METGEPTLFSRSFFDENENYKSNQISKNGKKFRNFSITKTIISFKQLFFASSSKMRSNLFLLSKVNSFF